MYKRQEEHQFAIENWLKNYTTNTDTALDYLSKVTLRQTFDGMINMYRLVGGDVYKRQKQDYDLIVLDVNLPDGNGFDFCREVKELSLIHI